MGSKRTALFLILIRNTLILGVIILLLLSFVLNYVYSNKFKTEYLNIIRLDKLIEDNVKMSLKNASASISFSGVPSSLTKYIECLNNSIKIDNVSLDLQNKINILDKYVHDNKEIVGFSYEDLNTGFSLGYRENVLTFAASTTKAPLAIYIYEQVSSGKMSLDSKYLYTSDYYATGTGIIKNGSFNTYYTLRDLVKYSIIYSDNSAYLMLSNMVDKKLVSEYFKEKGAINLYNSQNSNSLYQMFGEISPNDGNVYMKELYNYYMSNTKESNELLEYFMTAYPNYVADSINKPVAHKYGWTDNYINDIALVLDDHPYVLTVTTITDGDTWASIMKQIASLIDETHTAYWHEVNDYCKSLLD